MVTRSTPLAQGERSIATASLWTAEQFSHGNAAVAAVHVWITDRRVAEQVRALAVAPPPGGSS